MEIFIFAVFCNSSLLLVVVPSLWYISLAFIHNNKIFQWSCAPWCVNWRLLPAYNNWFPTHLSLHFIRKHLTMHLHPENKFTVQSQSGRSRICESHLRVICDSRRKQSSWQCTHISRMSGQWAPVIKDPSFLFHICELLGVGLSPAIHSFQPSLLHIIPCIFLGQLFLCQVSTCRQTTMHILIVVIKSWCQRMMATKVWQAVL